MMGITDRPRLAAVMGVLGGVLWMLGLPALDENLPPYSHAGGHLILAGAGLAWLICLTTSLPHWRRFGLGAATGAGIAAAGGALTFVGNLTEGAFEWEIGWGLFMLGVLSLSVGAVVLALATRGSGVVPTWTTVLLLVCPTAMVLMILSSVAIAAIGLSNTLESSPLAEAVGPAIALFSGLAWIGLGIALWFANGRRAVDTGRVASLRS